MQKAVFVAMMSKLRACYQNPVADAEMWTASVNQYWELVQHSDDEKIRAAFSVAWSKHRDWMPSLGQLMELIDSGGSNAKTRALDAWPELMKLVRRSSADHSDPIAKETMRQMGGGKALGQRSADDLEKWGKKEFCDLYEENAARLPPMLLNEAPAAGLLDA